MSKSIFISTVYEDSNRIASLKSWAAQGRLGVVTITHETEDMRASGKEEIKNHLREKIRGAAVVAVLIGNDTHNHKWIEAEVELANSFHKKVITIRVPNTTGAPPEILKKYQMINFDPDAFRKVLNEIV